MIIKVKTPEHKVLEFDVPDGSRLLVGTDVDGNDVFDGERIVSTAGGMEYEARLLPKVVERRLYDTDFNSSVDFRNLVRVDQLPYHQKVLYSAAEVTTKRIVVGELQKRSNGVRCFRSCVENALDNMLKNCYSWYIVDIEGAHQVIFETIKQVTNAGD